MQEGGDLVPCPPRPQCQGGGAGRGAGDVRGRREGCRGARGARGVRGGEEGGEGGGGGQEGGQGGEGGGQGGQVVQGGGGHVLSTGCNHCHQFKYHPGNEES